LDSTDSGLQEFCEAESNYFIKSFFDYLCSLTKAKWVNNRQKIYLAENKPLQLMIAKKLGLSVPKTLITNNPDLAYEFYLSQSKSIVLKALVGKGLPDRRLFYTTRLGSNLKKSEFNSVETTSTYFQEFIEKAYDIRIVVVESNIFSVKIESQEFIESSTDFRATDHKKLKHSIIDLPSPLKRCLLKLVKSLGLVHAEIDMCVTKDGKYIFFEINPNGQWLWLELQTGIKISDAFVNALIDKK
jgi:glutathione synthase/RimK-type ligase-like ATP-grasp enzyme